MFDLPNSRPYLGRVARADSKRFPDLTCVAVPIRGPGRTAWLRVTSGEVTRRIAFKGGRSAGALSYGMFQN